MNRSLIALGVAAAVAFPVAAQAAPKVYGKLNLSVENIDEDTRFADRWELVSNASRFGVKGEDELTANLSAVYQIEWEVSGDGNATDMGQRNRFLGIKHSSLGTLKLGKYDTYLKLAQGEVDLFNDLNADMGKVLAGENRVNNAIGYESPKFAGLAFNLMAIPGEESPNAATPAPSAGSTDDNHLGDYFSSSVVYSNEDLGLYAALAYDKDVSSNFAAIDTFGTAPAFAVGTAGSGASLKTDKTDILRAVVSYNLKEVGLTLNALVQQAERSEENTIATLAKKVPTEDSYLVSAAYKLGEAWVLKAQYVASTTSVDVPAVKDVDLTQTSIGADYNITSKTKVFGYYSLRNHSNENNPVLAANGKTQDYDSSFAGIGLDHKF
jgi:predicted porin